MLEFVQKIKSDIAKQIELDEIKTLSLFEKHFCIGAYIRNKFLLNSAGLAKLHEYYSTDNLDDLSAKILDEILKQ